MIIDFIDKQKIDRDDKKAVAQIVKDGFWGKMAKYFRYVNSDDTINILEQAITFDKGFYCKENGIVLGVVLLATKDIPYINFGRQAVKRLGFWNAFFLQLGFGAMKPKQNDGLKLEMIAVSPEARGKGVGTKMLDHLNKLAITEVFERITLEVIDSNDKAKILYERKGFVNKKYINTALFTRNMGFRGWYKMQKETK